MGGVRSNFGNGEVRSGLRMERCDRALEWGGVIAQRHFVIEFWEWWKCDRVLGMGWFDRVWE
ncbi:hypothetical protein [Cyanobacterium aponinum]|uniref:hypothetical protein n=1 Tax=Cyanobacterium aponinum TaxID=379064 RepID=UPI000C12DE84|nr:hypothetical protein [Cyanobacterium aponinum]